MLILLAETDYEDVYQFLDENFGKGKYFVKRDGTIRDYAHGWDVRYRIEQFGRKFKIRIYYAEAYRKTQKKQRSEDE